jgi:hypothetical protein
VSDSPGRDSSSPSTSARARGSPRSPSAIWAAARRSSGPPAAHTAHRGGTRAAGSRGAARASSNVRDHPRPERRPEASAADHTGRGLVCRDGPLCRGTTTAQFDLGCSRPRSTTPSYPESCDPRGVRHRGPCARNSRTLAARTSGARHLTPPLNLRHKTRTPFAKQLTERATAKSHPGRAADREVALRRNRIRAPMRRRMGLRAGVGCIFSRREATGGIRRADAYERSALA